MKILNRLLILSVSFISLTTAQLPFFLQRFRPTKHSLLSSGSTSYSSLASSLFPLSSSSSSFLSPAYGSHGSFLSGSSLSSPFSSSGLSSLSLSSPFSVSASSFSPHFGASSLSSSSLGSSLFAPSSFGSSSFAPNPHNAPHKFAASNLAHSLVDLGTVGNYDGLGSFDQAELLDDYPGFSNAGFAKDLNFAGSQTVKLHSSPSTPYNGEHVIYLQREAEK